jgi:Na+-translocating ferredoxin:NAD+ oxidoreductase subunit G
MKEILKNTSILFLIIIVLGIFLSSAYNFTKPKIEENQNNELIKKAKELFLSADNVIKKNDYYEVFSNEKKIGYIKQTSSLGYSSEIKLVIGIDLDKNIVGVKVLSQQETPGIGSKIMDESFLSKFIGKDKNKVAEEVDTITGATISSRAAINAVLISLEEI